MELKPARRFGCLGWAGVLFAVFLLLVFTPLGNPSTATLLQRHLGITDQADFPRVAAEFQSHGFEWDAWIYLEGTAERIERLLREQGFAEQTRTPATDARIPGVAFTGAPPPPASSEARRFTRERSGILDFAVLGPDSARLWFRALRY